MPGTIDVTLRTQPRAGSFLLCFRLKNYGKLIYSELFYLMLKLKKILLVLALFNFQNSVKAQDLNVTVTGDIYEYATYYVSSFDIGTGATNVQIFRYQLSSNIYPIYLRIRFRASMISPGLGINDQTTIVEILTDPFQIQDGLSLDNRDLSKDETTITDLSGNQIVLKGQLIDVLDPMVSEAIMQTVLTRGRLSDGEYTFTVRVEAGLTEEELSVVFDDSKTFVIQATAPIALESPGGALADTVDNLVYTYFPIFQWSSNPPVPGSSTFIRVAEFDPDIHSSLEDAVEDQRVLPFDQSEDWQLIEDVTSFQYPFSGAYPLEAGDIYCWQVRITLPTTAGEDEMFSPIYAFMIGAAGYIETTSAITDPFLMMLQQALGDEQFNSLFGSGNTLEGFVPSGQMEINGETVDQSSVNYLLNQFLSQSYQVESIQVEE